MRRGFEIAARVFWFFGAGITALGLSGVGFGLVASPQPAPSLNEGHGLAFFLGAVTTFVGVVVFSIGAAIRIGLKGAAPKGASRSPGDQTD